MLCEPWFFWFLGARIALFGYFGDGYAWLGAGVWAAWKKCCVRRARRALSCAVRGWLARPVHVLFRPSSVAFAVPPRLSTFSYSPLSRTRALSFSWQEAVVPFRLSSVAFAVASASCVAAQ